MGPGTTAVGLSQADADIVYFDREYGMNSTKAMDIWIAAYFENKVDPIDGAYSPI